MASSAAPMDWQSNPGVDRRLKIRRMGDGGVHPRCMEERSRSSMIGLRDPSRGPDED